jgi:hypothetical protein
MEWKSPAAYRSGFDRAAFVEGAFLAPAHPITIANVCAERSMPHKPAASVADAADSPIMPGASPQGM